MAKHDLELNSISRYSKESPQLILEEHGHCEVPAGCRQRRLEMDESPSINTGGMWLETAGEARVYLDGASLRSGRPMVAYGDHVLGPALSMNTLLRLDKH